MLLGVALLAALAPAVPARAALDPGVAPSAPPSNASQPLDPYLVSFSIEPAFIDDFLGNASSPNELVLRLLEQVEQRTGGIAVRPGGITADSSIYDASLSAVETLDLSASGGIYRTTYGPAFFEALNLLPDSTEVVMCLNFGNDSLDIASAQAQAAVEKLGSRLVALELGNEPDQYNSAQRNLSAWYAPEYTAEFKTWSTNLSTSLSLSGPFFQAGAMAMDPTSSARFTTADLIAAGIAQDDPERIRWFSQHMYQYSTCDPERDALITNVTTLINHENITAYVDLWTPEVTAAQSVGAQLVIGEFSSVSCSGKENVTDTFGQALWLVDTYLYSASINISRLYSHQGATLALQSSSQANTAGYSWYDFVYPRSSDRNGPAGATPSFVGFLLVAEALGSTAAANATQIAYFPLTDAAPELAVYAIWDPASRAIDAGPARLAVLNTGDADAVELDLSSLGATSLKRLRSSTSVQSRNASEALWAGQSYVTGSPVGDESAESVGTDGLVTVGAYEAVLVFLGNSTTFNASSSSTSTGSPTASASSSPSASASGSGGGSSAGLRAFASSPTAAALALGATLALATLA